MRILIFFLLTTSPVLAQNQKIDPKTWAGLVSRQYVYHHIDYPNVRAITIPDYSSPRVWPIVYYQYHKYPYYNYYFTRRW